MSAIVFGINHISVALCKQLKMDGYETVVISNNHSEMSSLLENIGVNIIRSHMPNPQLLIDIGGKHAEICVALTDNDELNLIICQTMRDLFHTKTTIAKVANVAYLSQSGYFSQHSIVTGNIQGIVSLEDCVATRIVENLRFVKGIDSHSVMKDQMLIIGLMINEKPEYDILHRLENETCVLIGILRGSDFLSPDTTKKLMEGDVMYLACEKNNMERLIYVICEEYAEMQYGSVVIIGGGSTGFGLAQKLVSSKTFSRLKIIEKDPTIAESMLNNLSNVEVLCGDAMSNEIISEAAIEDADFVISATDSDSVNVIASFWSKKMGCKYVASIVKDNDYTCALRSFGIDMTFNPIYIVLEHILTQIHIETFSHVYFIADARHMVIESIVSNPNMKIVGKKISQIQDSYGCNILAIMNSRGLFISPDQDYVITTGDEILLHTNATDLSDIKTLFKIN